VGVEHVGLGTDMLGFISPPVFRSYKQLPDLASALLLAGFSQAEVGAILGGNYRRVFDASVGCGFMLLAEETLPPCRP
jgi:membrane dipeptidase